MIINNMSDEELDHLFRKSAESFEPPYDPEAWIAMEEKLNRLEEVIPWWQKLLYPLLIVGLVCTIVGVISLTQNKTYIPETIKTAALDDRLTAGKQGGLSKGNETILLPLQEEQKKNADKIHVTSTAPGRVAASSAREVNNKESVNISDKILSEKAPKEYHITTGIRVAGMAEGTNIQQGPTPAVWSNDQGTYVAENIQEADKGDHALPASETDEKGRSFLLSDSKAEPDLQAESSMLEKSVNRKEFLSSLQFMVAVAPDITTVKFRNPDAVSMNAGLLVGVPLTKRISIMTGAIWANKVYGANPENYNPSPGFWYDKKLPNSIDATCKVLDIPLNIRYKLLDREKDVITIQTGLSSYIMLNEKYVYNYTYGYTPYSKTIEMSNRNRHWFGVQNISVGYSRNLSPEISVGVEPFIKFPLSGVGAGRVKLTSAGIFLTAGYTLQLKK